MLPIIIRINGMIFGQPWMKQAYGVWEGREDAPKVHPPFLRDFVDISQEHQGQLFAQNGDSKLPITNRRSHCRDGILPVSLAEWPFLPFFKGCSPTITGARASPPALKKTIFGRAQDPPL